MIVLLSPAALCGQLSLASLAELVARGVELSTRGPVNQFERCSHRYCEQSLWLCPGSASLCAGAARFSARRPQRSTSTR